MPVTRSTSAAPYARGAGNNFWASLANGLPGEAEPPCDSPQAIMMSPHRLSILSMPFS